MTQPDAPMPALTPKQRRFVEEFLIDMCAGKAAARAGYSEKTANQQGYLLLDNPAVTAAIDAAKTARSERLEVDSDYVLQRLFEEANADLADLYTDAGDLKPVDEWPPIWRQGLVAGLDIEALYDGHGKDRLQIGVVKKLRLSDRLRRIELIGKHIKVNAFQETVQHKGLDGLADRLDRARKRSSEPQASAPPPVEMAQQSLLPGRLTVTPNPETRKPLEGAASAPPPSPSPPKPPSQPYRPIVPAVPWPDMSGPALTDYNPLDD